MSVTTLNPAFILPSDELIIADKTFSSRLFTGTGKFSDQKIMAAALIASQSQLVTMALKRIDLANQDDDILKPLIAAGMHLLPNTSGARMPKKRYMLRN